jgi:RNA polymerase sigma factor (sigma-70 family)
MGAGVSIHPQTERASLAPNGWHWSLLRGFREGRQAALREVYRLHADDVARQLRHGFSFTADGRTHRFVGYGSAFELHDVLHETFARAFDPGARARYDGIRPYGPYLKAIARNIVLRGFRAREVLFPSIDDDVESRGSVASTAANMASPEQLVAREQIRELVQAFLRSLAPDDRQLLRLRFIEGRSQRDVALELGLGRQQVRGREDKLRKQLVRYLQRRGEAGLVHGALVPVWVLWALVVEVWP